MPKALTLTMDTRPLRCCYLPRAYVIVGGQSKGTYAICAQGHLSVYARPLGGGLIFWRHVCINFRMRAIVIPGFSTLDPSVPAPISTHAGQLRALWFFHVIQAAEDLILEAHIKGRYYLRPLPEPPP